MASSSASQLRIGRYALLGRVGRGGMGEVHRARAFGAAGVTKELCIKRIRRSRLDDPDALARFVDEARLWMRLSHGNIVPVFDFGRIENDYYLAMEWVDGCDLRRLLDDAKARADPLEDEVILFIAAAIARALSYLHDAEAHEGRAVAHCDLKPGNVLISRSGEAKLADFGVAVATDSARAGGTRGYIRPAEDGADHVDETDDLFALGRVLSDLLEHAGTPRAPSTEREGARRIARRLVGRSTARGDVTATQIADELDDLSARLRVRSGRSPRELLVARVSRVPSNLETTDVTDLQTDASFVTGGADERSFLSSMEAPSERSTSSRKPPALTRRTRTGGEWGLLGLASVGVALGVFFAARTALPSASVVEPPAHEDSTRATVVEHAAHEALPAAPAVELAAPRPSPAAIAHPALELGATDHPRSDRMEHPSAAVTEPRPLPTRAEAARGDELRPRMRAAAASSDRGDPERGALAAEAATPDPSTSSRLDEEADGVPHASAHLRINARPWADVTVDGVAHGTTPITDLELSPGRHEVRLVHPVTGRESTSIVELSPGERRDVIVDLRR